MQYLTQANLTMGNDEKEMQGGTEASYCCLVQQEAWWLRNAFGFK